ncbi:MAG: NUDIX domain-containing protein [Chloroflexota bacterium]
MSLDGQRVNLDRYSLVPRTLSFLIQDDQILLLKLNRGAWSGLYNGIGGHIEQGEDPLSAARREVEEEAGLSAVEQRLAGVVAVDTGSKPGIGLFVFVGEIDPLTVRSGREGTFEWVPVSRVADFTLVEDLPFLIPRALESYRRSEVFFAAYRYSPDGELRISSSSQ